MCVCVCVCVGGGGGGPPPGYEGLTLEDTVETFLKTLSDHHILSAQT